MYIIAKVSPIIIRVELVRIKGFVTADFDPEEKSFVLYLASIISANSKLVHSFYGA